MGFHQNLIVWEFETFSPVSSYDRTLCHWCHVPLHTLDRLTKGGPSAVPCRVGEGTGQIELHMTGHGIFESGISVGNLWSVPVKVMKVTDSLTC